MRRNPRMLRCLWLVALVLLLAACDERIAVSLPEAGPVADWPAWGGGAGGGHFTPLQEIAPDNLAALELVWTHRSGDFRSGPDLNNDAVDLQTTMPASAFQATPIVVEGRLYYCSPFNRVFALDPETGEQLWVHDPGVNMDEHPVTNCRGVSSWVDPDLKPGARCRHRILAPTLDARILALDGETGERCTDFGSSGEIRLTQGMGPHPARAYAVTSPPAIVGDTLVTGAFVIDAWDTGVPAGVVRAFDLRSGAQRWAWNPVAPGRPAVDEAGHYVRGTTNVWSVIAVDAKLGLVFVPTGNSSPDYYGGQRDGHLDYYSSSIVALRAATGEVAWHVRTVNHDIWDFDVPAQPTLVDLRIGGKEVPALVQVTKMGLTWVVDRRDGKALFEIEERPVPQTGAVPGEYLAATQPFPLLPEPLHPLTFSADDAWGFTPWDRGRCREAIEQLDHGPIYTPISQRGTVLYPAPTGGNNWGSPAVDPTRGIMIASAMRVPFVARLTPRAECTGRGREMPQTGTPYCVRMELLRSPLGAPCSAPPWGTLAAVDLHSGKRLWEVPLGSFAGVVPLVGGLLKGAPGFGGSLLTASGLIFTAASSDPVLRAFDVDTGAELRHWDLPTQAASVPMSYRVRPDGRQFIVLAAGGHWTGALPPGDHLMAFALKPR